MYEELVKQLRYKAGWDESGDLEQAADAIEELSREYESIEKSMTESVERVRKLQSPRWIPVTERLPGEFGRYLCRYRVEEGQTIGYCTDFGRYDPEHGEWFVGTVTHWMQIPEPPKEEA